MAKQKLKGYYGNIGERQFRRLYHRGRAPQGRYRREFDRLARAPSRRGGLPHEIRAQPVRRAPARQSRPRHGERQARQHRLLSREGWRRRSKCATKSKNMAVVIEAVGLDRARRPGLHRSRSRRSSRASSCARPSSPTCPIRCRWNRTSSSNSIRADCRDEAADRQYGRPLRCVNCHFPSGPSTALRSSAG